MERYETELPVDYFGADDPTCGCGCGRPLTDDPIKIDGKTLSDWCASDLSYLRNQGIIEPVCYKTMKL